MDSSPPSSKNIGDDEREAKLLAQQEKQASELEKQRIKSMRGRNGAISLFSDVNPNQNQGTLG